MRRQTSGLETYRGEQRRTPTLISKSSQALRCAASTAIRVYRGHNHPDPFKVWISGQVRRVTKAIRREMLHRAAVEPVIGHLKDDNRMRRNHLKRRDGDRINAARRRWLQLQPALELVRAV
jgi:hypothetical protein